MVTKHVPGGKYTCEEGKSRITAKIKVTKAKEENERIRVEIKGAVSTKGENKLHEGGNKM